MNIIMAVNMGGDDFVPKPFDLSVLTANPGGTSQNIRPVRKSTGS